MAYNLLSMVSVSTTGGAGGSLCARQEPLLKRHNASSSLVGIVGSQAVGAWRYFSVFSCQSGQSDTVCLAFMNRGKWEQWVGTVMSHDDGRSFGGEGSAPTLTLPAHWEPEPGRRIDWMTSNLAIARHPTDGSYMLFGGLSQRHATTPGIVYARGGTHQYSSDRGGQVPLPTAASNGQWTHYAERSQWRDVRTLFDGRHEGCVEGRRGIDKLLNATANGGLACEFDGRISAVHFRGRHWLYVRANPALSGQRFVQVTSSHDLYEWRPFQLLRFDGYRPVDGDIYFLAVQLNPLSPSSLVGLVPVVHRRVGCIGLAASLDGVRWSAITPLLRCSTDYGDPTHPGHRTTHQPAAGMLHRHRHVLLFVHEFVDGIVQHPQGQHQRPARLRRWAVPEQTFSAWTQDALKSLTEPSH